MRPSESPFRTKSSGSTRGRNRATVPKPERTREFLYCVLQQGEFRDSLAQSASGISNRHQRVRPSDPLARPLVVPTKAMLDAFADQVVPQVALREALQAESSTLATLRDYLLPRLLSGRVRVEVGHG
jgi:type I restriction enzyme S subunit